MRLLSWIIVMLDFRLAANGWGNLGQQLRDRPLVSTGEGGQQVGGQQGGFGTTPAPAPAPTPIDTGPDWAENRQTANIDRTSAYSHRSYRAALEGIDQTARAASPDMPAGASDYELPDTAFGQRLY